MKESGLRTTPSGSLFEDSRLDRIQRQVMSTEEARAVVDDIRWLVALNSTLAKRHGELAEAAIGMRDALLRGSPGWLESNAGRALLAALEWTP